MVTPTPDQREDYEERAAILEFEANLSRPEAERRAAEMCFPRTQGDLFVPQSNAVRQDRLVHRDIQVTFSPADVAHVAAFVAQMQSVKNNIHKVDQTPEQARGNQMSGKLAELAFGQYFGWPVDFSINVGGDGGVDFRLHDGVTVDTKSVWVQTRMDYNYTLALLAAERLSTHFVQVLVDSAFARALITGGISRERFLAIATPHTGWSTDGEAPLAVRRSQLSRAFPASFWSETA